MARRDLKCPWQRPLQPLYQLKTGLNRRRRLGDRRTRVCALDANGKKVGARSFKHSGDGLADLTTWLRAKADPNEIAISIEVPHGSVVETLLERGFAVYSINPKQLDRFRDRFTMAGAKDDRLDALVLADSLRTDTHLFRRLSQQSCGTIELREWSRIHDELTA